MFPINKSLAHLTKKRENIFCNIQWLLWFLLLFRFMFFLAEDIYIYIYNPLITNWELHSPNRENMIQHHGLEIVSVCVCLHFLFNFVFLQTRHALFNPCYMECTDKVICSCLKWMPLSYIMFWMVPLES